jgi:hypothetical protein
MSLLFLEAGQPYDHGVLVWHQPGEDKLTCSICGYLCHHPAAETLESNERVINRSAAD